MPTAFDTIFRCPECGRLFDVTDEDEADEFFNGHDCEAE